MSCLYVRQVILQLTNGHYDAIFSVLYYYDTIR